MMKEITKYHKPEIIFPHCEIKKVGLIFSEKMAFDEWEMIGQTLNQIEGSTQWWIGDWLNAGERKWGEKYLEAQERTGFDYQTLAHAKSVSGAVDFCRRRQKLSWSHHQEVASLEPEEQDSWLDRAEKENLTRSQLRELIRIERIARETPVLPPGKYRVIYADPPWLYHAGDQHTDEAQKTVLSTHYDPMKLEEICAMPIEEKSGQNAVLFLWAPSPLIPEALQVIEAWGFEYKASFVWDKIKHNVGYYNSVRHELLLIATRGSCLPDSNKLTDSVQSIERTEHSRKPEAFRKIIDEMYYPAKRRNDRIELFIRGTPPVHWDSWGNEANK